MDLGPTAFVGNSGARSVLPREHIASDRPESQPLCPEEHREPSTEYQLHVVFKIHNLSPSS